MPASHWLPSGKAARRIAGYGGLYGGALIVGFWVASLFASCSKNPNYAPSAENNSPLDYAAIYDTIVVCSIRGFNAWVWRSIYPHHHAIEIVLGIVRSEEHTSELQSRL